VHHSSARHFDVCAGAHGARVFSVCERIGDAFAVSAALVPSDQATPQGETARTCALTVFLDTLSFSLVSSLTPYHFVLSNLVLI